MSHSHQPPLGPADPGRRGGGTGGTGGFGPPSYLSGPGGTQKPPTSGRDRLVLGLLVASLVLGLLGTAGIVYGLNKDDGTPTAGSPDGPRTSEAPTDEPTETPTDDPSESPTDEPSETPTDDPTEEPSDPPARGKKLKASEYRDDWNFQLGDVKLSAKNAGSWDYRTCAPVEKDRSMTSQGCRYAVEASYKAKSGNLQFTHIFFGMRNDKAAKRAAENMKEEDFTLQDGRFLADFAAGKFRTSATGDIVVVTVATRTDKVKGKVLDDYIHYAHVDFKSALLFRSIG